MKKMREVMCRWKGMLTTAKLSSYIDNNEEIEE
jgi:hypothetical protein